MALLVRAFVLLALVPLGARANASLDHARYARELLGPEVWSCLIRIENEARLRPYPRELHALVFELAGILWFYTDVNGTQSFSLRRGNLVEDKVNFGPLLHAIEPGFVRWTAVADDTSHRRGFAGALPNGCFVESVAALRKRVTAGLPVPSPQLLSYYIDTPYGRLGHTVLTYRSGEGVAVADPGLHGRTIVYPAEFTADALALARAWEGDRVIKARWLPVELTGSLEKVAGGESRVRGENRAIERPVARTTAAEVSATQATRG